MPASTDDILTAIKNIVTAINNQTQNTTNLAGVQNFYGVTTTTLIQKGPGRIVNISVTVAGSSPGTVYDTAFLGDVPRLIFEFPATVGIYNVNLPVKYGIVVEVGTGMTVAGSYS